MDIYFAATLFLSFSLIGWIIEVIYRSWAAKKFVNPGALIGPYLPIYGSCVILIACCESFIHELNFMYKIIVFLL